MFHMSLFVLFRMIFIVCIYFFTSNPLILSKSLCAYACSNSYTAQAQTIHVYSQKLESIYSHTDGVQYTQIIDMKSITYCVHVSFLFCPFFAILPMFPWQKHIHTFFCIFICSFQQAKYSMLIHTIHNYYVYFPMLFGQSLNSLCEINFIEKDLKRWQTTSGNTHAYIKLFVVIVVVGRKNLVRCNCLPKNWNPLIHVKQSLFFGVFVILRLKMVG